MTNTAARFRDLVDAALALHTKSPEYHPQLNAALASARDHVARALAEASTALSAPPVPALERVAVEDLKVGDRVLTPLIVRKIDPNDQVRPIMLESEVLTGWAPLTLELFCDPREVWS